MRKVVIAIVLLRYLKMRRHLSLGAKASTCSERTEVCTALGKCENRRSENQGLTQGTLYAPVRQGCCRCGFWLRETESACGGDDGPWKHAFLVDPNRPKILAFQMIECHLDIVFELLS